MGHALARNHAIVLLCARSSKRFYGQISDIYSVQCAFRRDCQTHTGLNEPQRGKRMLHLVCPSLRLAAFPSA